MSIILLCKCSFFFNLTRFFVLHCIQQRLTHTINISVSEDSVIWVSEWMYGSVWIKTISSIINFTLRVGKTTSNETTPINKFERILWCDKVLKLSFIFALERASKYINHLKHWNSSAVQTKGSPAQIEVIPSNWNIFNVLRLLLPCSDTLATVFHKIIRCSAQKTCNRVASAD